METQEENPLKIGTTSGKTRLSNLSIVLCQAERTFECCNQKSVLGPVLFNILICYFDNERTSMLLGFADNTKPERTVSPLEDKSRICNGLGKLKKLCKIQIDEIQERQVVKKGKNQIHVYRNTRFWHHILRMIDRREIKVLENITCVEIWKEAGRKKYYLKCINVCRMIAVKIVIRYSENITR